MNRNLYGSFLVEDSSKFVDNGCKNQGWGMFSLLLMAFFALFLSGKAMGQTDYSGVYYIASAGYNASTPEANYYLCPTEGWIYYRPTDNWSADGTTYPNPFLTTYKCKTAAYHSGNSIDAVWIIEMAPNPNQNYYYIKQASTGKYIVSNGQISGTSNANRMRVHLEAVAEGNLDDKELFSITPYPVNNPTYLVISPKSSDGWNGNDYKWYTVNNGNKNYLVGNGSNGGPTGYASTGGILGLYTQGDANAKFYLEDAVQQPVISQASNGDIAITCATNNTTIYYTLDGSNPVVPADGAPDPTGPTYKYTGAFTPALGCEGVKAVAVLSNLHAVVSKMAELSFSTYSTPTISFNGNDQVTISASHADATIYYTTDGSDPIVGTSSVYSTPITVTVATTVKAIATHTGYLTSDMATLAITQVATPTIQNNGNNAISITSATPGATIYYTTDGSTPTTSSNLYTTPLQENVSGVTIKAIAVKENMINSEVGIGSVTLQCETPVITRVGMSFTLSCSMPTDANLYYRLDGGSETEYSGAVTFTIDQLPMTVTAVARHSDYTQSETATYLLTSGTGTPSDPYLIYSDSDFSAFVTDVNNGTTASVCYKLGTDVSASGTAAITTAFTGTFDGDLYTITDLTHPLFNTVNSAVIKNVILKNVSISGSGNVGAICNEAKGYTRIYNCGILPTTANFPDDTHSTVTATGANGCAGGLVGLLDDDSRVVNCFSYADVYSSDYAAGIVGNNTFASTAEVSNGKYYKLRTMVVNCIFYGDIKSGNSIWPVYGGQKITNAGTYAINNYNYYSDSCHFANRLEDTHMYNCSWPARYEYLTHYEFHRYLLNSNRELCGWWVGAPSAPATMTTAEVQAVPKDGTLMAKWVLDPAVAPYPILKPFGRYFSSVNIDADASWRISANEWEGKKLGTLAVTVKSGAQHSANDVYLYIPITDMDTLHGDFCYRKIQLPYYNSVFGDPNSSDWSVKYAHNYGEYVVTGWEITSTDGADGTFIQDWQDGYNFADRYCSKKDKYSVSGRVFAQGGYYYVPYDVTAITITAHWGKAYYMSNGDYYYDRVNFAHDNNKPGTAFAPTGTRSDIIESNGQMVFVGNGQIVRTGKIKDVANGCNMSGGINGSVYDNAIVLIGNHQYCTGDESIDPSRSFTIMSPDFDLDDEPDYCLEWQLGTGTTRRSFCPMRIDFLPVMEIGLAVKKDGSTQYYSLGVFRPLGHYEVTETSLIRFGQFEFSNKSRTIYAPLILNAGLYEQYTNGPQAMQSADDRIDYIILGGHAYLLSFTPGCHVDQTAPTRHCAVNAIGGKINKLFLSGNYNETAAVNRDNPHCYIDGGWFDHIASAGKEGINGDVTFKINHARIKEFYGGGIMANHPVTGKIEVTVDNSRVYKYCGGPKFGDMTLDEAHPENNKTVTTNAKGTFFIEYYGAGNGGTNYMQYHRTDGTYPRDNASFSWEAMGIHNGNLDDYIPGDYINSIASFKADYELEMINVSTGSLPNNMVIRTYFYAAQFATTNTGSVTNTLLDCVVKKNFYGAGNLGGVHGNVTSTLTDTEVQGSAFGGGFSASIPEVKIYNKDKSYPTIDLYTGYITPSTGGTYTSYIWSNDPSLSTSNPAGDGIFFTEVPLVNLGTVTGNVDFTINGGSTVGGSIFGGGDESAVNGNTLVKVLDQTKVFGNIYGGGNMGHVDGDTKVIINGRSTGQGTGQGTASGNNPSND